MGIIDSILKAPPTDGLWDDNRTDEDQIGATYSELEWAMNYKESNDKLNDKQRSVLKKYRELNTMNKHKMVSIPVCKIPSELR